MPEMTIQQAIDAATEHHRAGRLNEAELIYRQILTAQPGNSEAMHLLGLIAYKRGQFRPAIQLITQAIGIDPTQDHYRSNLSQVWHGFGLALHNAGEHLKAVSAFKEAISLHPDYFEALYHSGNAHFAAGQFADAAASFEQARALRPDVAEATNNLGNALHELGRFDEAMKLHQLATELKPDWTMAHYNLGVSLLLAGDLKRGWIENEWRCRVESLHHVYPTLPKPRWDGGELYDRRLLITTEQGLGDSIQFARYAALLVERGAQVVFQSAPELHDLLRTCAGIGDVVAQVPDGAHYDLHCPLLTLPMHFGTTLANIPTTIPYVRADATKSVAWHEKLSQTPGGLKVGLVWAGKSDHTSDRNRSMSLSALAPLAAASQVRFISLQKGPAGAEAAKSQIPIIDWTDQLYDFSDTAALIDSLDLVISVDTAVAHLAGAMGKRVWVLVQFVPDWRWMLERTDSPWYPTMRLFRQPALGNWSTPIEQIAQELQCLK